MSLQPALTIDIQVFVQIWQSCINVLLLTKIGYAHQSHAHLISHIFYSCFLAYILLINLPAYPTLLTILHYARARARLCDKFLLRQ